MCSVMYRYDIVYALNQLARAMSNPFKAHMAAAKHLLRYLAGTSNLSITYKQGETRLTVFPDANGQHPRQQKIDLPLPSVSFERPSQVQNSTARADDSIDQ